MHRTLPFVMKFQEWSVGHWYTSCIGKHMNNNQYSYQPLHLHLKLSSIIWKETGEQKFKFHNESYLSLISTYLPLRTQNYNIPFNRTRPTNFFHRSYSCKNSENLSDVQLHESSFYPKVRNYTKEQNKHCLIFRSKTVLSHVVPCLTVSLPSSVTLCLKWIKIPVADLKRQNTVISKARKIFADKSNPKIALSRQRPLPSCSCSREHPFWYCSSCFYDFTSYFSFIFPQNIPALLLTCSHSNFPQLFCSSVWSLWLHQEQSRWSS